MKTKKKQGNSKKMNEVEARFYNFSHQYFSDDLAPLTIPNNLKLKNMNKHVQR